MIKLNGVEYVQPILRADGLKTREGLYLADPTTIRSYAFPVADNEKLIVTVGDNFLHYGEKLIKGSPKRINNAFAKLLTSLI